MFAGKIQLAEGYLMNWGGGQSGKNEFRLSFKTLGCEEKGANGIVQGLGKYIGFVVHSFIWFMIGEI